MTLFYPNIPPLTNLKGSTLKLFQTFKNTSFLVWAGYFTFCEAKYFTRRRRISYTIKPARHNGVFHSKALALTNALLYQLVTIKRRNIRKNIAPIFTKITSCINNLSNIIRFKILLKSLFHETFI